MASEKRNSGIDLIGYIPWGTHLCQFYNSREDLIEILVPYFKARLENNERCIWSHLSRLMENLLRKQCAEPCLIFTAVWREGR